MIIIRWQSESRRQLLKSKEENKNRFFYLLLTFLVALVVADGTITRFLVMHRLGVEANPFLQEWVESDLLLILKLAGAGSAAFILWRVYKRIPNVAWTITSIFIALYTLLILWNLTAFFIARTGRI